MSWTEAVGYLASALVFATFCMTSMIPLRIAAICSNVAFIVYAAALGPLYPILVLHAILLPINVWRTVGMLRLIRRVRRAAKGELSADWLKPFMRAARHEAGHVLFHRDDHGDVVYMILNGRLQIEELAYVAGPGEVVGEIALFAAERRRTQTVRCLTEVELLVIGEKDLARLCFQKPDVSFFLLRLITHRLGTNASLRMQSAQPILAAGGT
jgi:CRP/FNR family transcriptional regulator, cyclic AMP receptor protein